MLAFQEYQRSRFKLCLRMAFMKKLLGTIRPSRNILAKISSDENNLVSLGIKEEDSLNKDLSVVAIKKGQSV